MVYTLTRNLGSDRAEVSRLWVNWVADVDSEVRAAAVEGLYLTNGSSPDPALFGVLTAMLRDPVANVRHRAVYSVGAYVDAAALNALKPVVNDLIPGVRSQATIAVGWVATNANADKMTRTEANQVLRQVAQTPGAATKEAVYWLQQAGER